MRGTCLFCFCESERMIYSIPFRVVVRAKLKRNISRFKMNEHQPRESLFCGWFSRLASGHFFFFFLFFFSRCLNSRCALHYDGTCDAARTCERYITQVDGNWTLTATKCYYNPLNRRLFSWLSSSFFILFLNDIFFISFWPQMKRKM